MNILYANHSSFHFIFLLIFPFFFFFLNLSTTYLVYLFYLWTSLVAQSVKNLPAMQETRVWSLGWEDPLEKEMATHSSIVS